MRKMYEYQRFSCYKVKHVTRAVTCSTVNTEHKVSPLQNSFIHLKSITTCSPEYYAVFPGVKGVIPFVFLVEITWFKL